MRFFRFLFFLALGPGSLWAQQVERPNFVVIFTDDLGYGDLSCYGHPQIRTPHLDRMAAEGIRYTSFYAAASVCTPSRAALLTGRYPIRHLPYNLGPGSEGGLPLDEQTLAQILQSQGYRSMAIGKWHLGHQPDYLPTARGFDRFYGLPYSNDMLLPWCPWLDSTDRLFLYEDGQATEEVGFAQETLTEDYTEQAIGFIEAHQDEPFFLYLAHSMPHLPISTSERFRGQSEAGLYGDVIETIDWSVGQILDRLQALGLDERTVVVFTSDNGPWLNLPERMLQLGVERWHAGSPGPLRGAKGTTYEGGFRVPGIVRWPRHIAAGQVSNQVVSTMDLLPSLVHLAGAELPGDRPIDGRNLGLQWQGAKIALPETPFFYLSGNRLQAVRQGPWKLRFTPQTGTELFHLRRDPAEAYNQAEEKPDVVARLTALMEVFATETGAEWEQE